MTKWQTAFHQELPELAAQTQFDASLADVTYFKIGGPAEMVVEVRTLPQLQAVRRWATKNDVPFTILGGASNVIVADEGVTGVVCRITAAEVSLAETSGALVVEAGCRTALLVRKSIELGFQGLEYFLGVPGTVGGAVYNNAHYLEYLLSDYISRVQVVSAEGESEWLPKQACDFAYDHSRFQTSGESIWAVEFQLPAGDEELSLSMIKDATEYRARTQPLGEPSSGCIFQNTPNTPELRRLFPQFAERELVPGGFLIDQAGLKGRKVGDIMVSHKHAAFMVNTGKGRAADVKELIEIVKSKVKKKFGVDLHEEVFYLGKQL